MISCYLLFSQILPNPQDALKFFGVNRTSNGKGVTIPSQKRYVYYFNRFLHEYYWCSPQKPFPFSGKPFVLTSVVFSSVPRIDSTNGCTPFFKIHRLDGRKIYDSRKIVKPKNFVNESGKRKLISKFSSSASSIEISCAARVRGDVKISFFHEDVYSFDKPMFHCWINTVFLYDNHIVLKKHELDKAVKDTGHKKYDEDFCIEMIFRPDDISVVEVDQVESNESFLKSIRDGNKDPWDAEKLCEKLKDLELELAEERKLCNSLVSQIEEFNEENDGLSLQIAALKSHPSM